MLSIPAPFPHVGALAYFDDGDAIEPVRILRDNGDGTRLVSLTGRRYPHEAASGNRNVPLTALRETAERPHNAAKGRPRRKVAGAGK